MIIPGVRKKASSNQSVKLGINVDSAHAPAKLGNHNCKETTVYGLRSHTWKAGFACSSVNVNRGEMKLVHEVASGRILIWLKRRVCIARAALSENSITFATRLYHAYARRESRRAPHVPKFLESQWWRWAKQKSRVWIHNSHAKIKLLLCRRLDNIQ